MVDKTNQILEKLRGMEEKIRMSMPTEQVIITEFRVFGRFTILTKLTHIDLKDNWVIKK